MQAITAIYSKEVLTGLATFETVPSDFNEMSSRRQTLIDNNYPYLVACIGDKVVGYAYAGPYRPRTAYQHCVENSIYVDDNARSCGVGKQLLEHLIEECENDPWRQMILAVPIAVMIIS